MNEEDLKAILYLTVSGEMPGRDIIVFREEFGIFKLIYWLHWTSYCGQRLAAMRASWDIICKTSACYLMKVTWTIENHKILIRNCLHLQFTMALQIDLIFLDSETH